jgi:POT family proton-dependent oligopeptide transporter
LNNLALYSVLRRWGVDVTTLRRMGFGIAFSGFAWIAAGTVHLAIDGGRCGFDHWQVLPYVQLTFGEVLVSATGHR